MLWSRNLKRRVENLAAHDLAEAGALRGGDLGGAVRNAPVSAAMPKLPSARPAPTSSEVRPAEGEFEVMDYRGAVGRDRADDTVAQKAADHRAEPDLYRMRARSSAGRCAWRARPPRFAARGRAGRAPQGVGQRVEEFAQGGAGLDFGGETVAPDQARERREFFCAGAARINRPEFHLHRTTH